MAYTQILLPDHAPAEYKDRAVLWNAVEKCERYKTAQLAREIEIALPAELSLLENKSLVRRYVQENFVDKGMCADITIHDKKDGNPHAHILLTMRPIEIDGAWGAKSKKEYITDENSERIVLKSGAFKTRKIYTTDWNDQSRAEEWRQAWADTANLFLEKLKHEARIDHRSFERQGIDQIPTVHMGVAATQMERRGNINRKIEISNQKLRELKARISKLQNWLKEETAKTESPTLADVVQGILERRAEKGGYYAVQNLKAAASTINFLTAHKIMSLAGLDNCFRAMIHRQYDIRDKQNPIDRRLKVLDEHIKHAETYRQYREIDRQYKTQKPKKQEAFFETHRMELTLFQSAERYLKNVMNGRTALPARTWKEERAELATAKQQLDNEYRALKTEVSAAEKIRSEVHSIIRQEQRREQPHRGRDMER